MGIKEKTVETYLEKEVRRKGGRAFKLACIGLRNFPDRTVLLPGGYIVFAECKVPKKDLRKTQQWFKDKVLVPLGFKFYTVRFKEDVNRIISDYEKMDPRTIPKVLRRRR